MSGLEEMEFVDAEPAELDRSQGRRCVVRYSPEGWRVVFGAHDRGRFDYQVDAMDAALRLVGDGAMRGAPVDLWVQDRFGTLERVAADAMPAAA